MTPALHRNAAHATLGTRSRNAPPVYKNMCAMTRSTPLRWLQAVALGATIGILVTGPGIAVAQDDDWGSGTLRGTDHVNLGGYLVIGGLTGFETFRDDAGQDFDSTFGFVLKGGARLHRNFAAEVEGNFLSGFDTVVDLRNNPDIPAGFPPFAALTVDGGNVTVNAVAYLPLGRIQPKAVVGLGGMWARLRSTYPVSVVCGPSFWYYWYCTGAYARIASGGGFVMRFGGGVDFQIADDWALVVDATYVKPFGELEDLTYVNLNWGIRFDF